MPVTAFIQSVYPSSVLTSRSGSAWAAKVASGAQYVLQPAQPLPVSQASKNDSATRVIDAMSPPPLWSRGPASDPISSSAGRLRDGDRPQAGQLPDPVHQARRRLHLLPLDLLDDLHQRLVGRSRDAGLVALLRHQPVQEVDLGAAALQDVLARRGAALLGHAAQSLEHVRLDLLVGRPVS